MTTEQKLYAILGPNWWEELKRGIKVSNNQDAPEQEQMREQVLITQTKDIT